jgi:hypothetical protein
MLRAMETLAYATFVATGMALGAFGGIIASIGKTLLSTDDAGHRPLNDMLRDNYQFERPDFHTTALGASSDADGSRALLVSATVGAILPLMLGLAWWSDRDHAVSRICTTLYHVGMSPPLCTASGP